MAVLLFLVLLGTGRSLYIFAVSVIVLIFATFAINFKRLNFTWPHLLLPTIYLLAVGSVFVLISNPSIRLIFLLLAAATFYFLEMKLGLESHFLQNIYLFSVFGVFLGMFALQFYFNLKIWWLAPLAFVLTYVFAVQGFAGFSLPAKRYFYGVLSLICTEAVWGMTFWPTHFFVNSIVLFCIFYLLWLFSFSAFFGKLTREKIYWQLALVALVLVLTLSTAAWRPIR